MDLALFDYEERRRAQGDADYRDAYDTKVAIGAVKENGYCDIVWLYEPDEPVLLLSIYQLHEYLDRELVTYDLHWTSDTTYQVRV